MQVTVGSFVKQAGTGNQDIPITVDLSAAAAGTWAVIFWEQNYVTTTGVWAAHQLGSFGFAANGGGSVSEFAVGMFSGDNTTPSNTAHRAAAACITAPDGTGASTSYQANFVGFTSPTNMRINWSTANAGGQVNYMILSGLTGAKVVQWSSPTSTGTKSVTGVGFNPDLVLHAIPLMAAVGSLAHAYFGMGMMNKHGQQAAVSLFEWDNVSPSNTSHRTKPDQCIAQVGSSESTSLTANYLSMDADGFSVYFTGVEAGARVVGSLCMDGVTSKIGAIESPTSATTQVVASRHDFTAKGMAMFGSALNARTTPDTNAAWFLGATDLTNTRTMAMFDYDNQFTTQVDSIWSTSSLIIEPSNGPTAYGAASLSAITTSDFTLSWSAHGSSRMESFYLLLGDTGTNTFPTQIDFVSSAPGTGENNQKQIVELSSGRLVATAHVATQAWFYYSDDGGVTWTLITSSTILGWNNGSIAAYNDGSHRVCVTWKQSGTGGGRTDGNIYVMVGTLSGSTMTWGTAISISQNNGVSQLNYPDVTAVAEGAGGMVFVTTSYAQALPENLVLYCRLSVSGTTLTPPALGSGVDGLIDSSGSDYWSLLGGGYTKNVHTSPSIVIDTTTKRLHVCWGAGDATPGRGIRYRTAAYSAGSWTWATEVEVATDVYDAGQSQGVRMHWDGTRAVIVGWLFYTSVPNYYIRIWDSTTFTAFTQRVDQVVSTANEDGLYGVSSAVAANGDVYVFGSIYDGTNYSNLSYFKATRSGTSLSIGSRVVVDYFASSASTWAAPSAHAITNKIAWIYTHGQSPYPVRFDRLDLTPAASSPGGLQMVV